MTLPQLSTSVQNLHYSVIREMSAMATTMTDVINLSIGAPDFATPAEIIEHAFADARNGHTHYTPSQGDPELIERLAQSLSQEQKRTISTDSILITDGGMGALTATLRTLLNPGDHVLLVEPHFPDYLAHITFAEGVAVKAVSTREEGFIPSVAELKKAITPQTKLLLLNSPNNPTGAVIPPERLDEIAAFAVQHNLYVISDEVYDRILFSPPFDSIVTREGMVERTVVIKSFSKSYAMTGWRVGVCCAPPEIISQIVKVVNYSTACASSISQRAALAALDCRQEIIEEMVESFRRRTELVYTRLTAMPGVEVVRPGGSFYLFTDMRAFSKDSRELAIRLLKEQRVITVPGYAFGNSCEGFLRIACTTNCEKLSLAMDRFAAFVENLRDLQAKR